jgi:hypothetical protein
MTETKQKKPAESSISSSFRDPGGFVFFKGGKVYRKIGQKYAENYKLLIKTKLYDDLVSQGFLIPHKEILPNKLIQPERIPFVSYPYEWCFGMLKDAALLTLDIERQALKHGMSLKDANSFNIQFLKSKPIFIDTLSFVKYQEGKPWSAYKQFVEYFLNPLLLMSYKDVRLGRLLRIYINGVPLDLTAKLLPLRAFLNPGIFLHVLLHSFSQRENYQVKIDPKKLNENFSKTSFFGLIESLRKMVEGLNLHGEKSEWSNYYDKGANNYSDRSMKKKGDLVNEYVSLVKPEIVWDVAGNSGYFARVAAKYADLAISFDNDYGALEKNYSIIKEQNENNILPLFCDFTNPTPPLGWANEERESLVERGKADLVMALAFIHHLAISNNLPFLFLASFFSKIGRYLIIEFIPKDDSQVQKLLTNRLDIYDNYNKENFEKVFKKYFKIIRAEKIAGSVRTLYLMEKEK